MLSQTKKDGYYIILLICGTKRKNTHRKRGQICSYHRQEAEEVELEEDGQGYKFPVIREISTKDVICNMVYSVEHCCMVCMKVVKSVNPKSCHPKKMCFFHFVLFMYLYGMMYVK